MDQVANTVPDLLTRAGAAYTIKALFYGHLKLRQRVCARRQWTRVTRQMSCAEHRLMVDASTACWRRDFSSHQD